MIREAAYSASIITTPPSMNCAKIYEKFNTPVKASLPRRITASVILLSMNADEAKKRNIFFICHTCLRRTFLLGAYFMM